MVNTLFFLLLPIAWCTSCCCCVSNSQLHDFDSDSSVRGRKLIQNEIYSDEGSEDENDNEDLKLLRAAATPSSNHSMTSEKYKKSSETVFDVRNLQNPFDDEQLESDTAFVVSAINESHESLSKLVRK